MFVAHLEDSKKAGLTVTWSISTASNHSGLTGDMPAQEDSELGWARSISAYTYRVGVVWTKGLSG
jgi:hypothetical protein